MEEETGLSFFIHQLDSGELDNFLDQVIGLSPVEKAAEFLESEKFENNDAIFWVSTNSSRVSQFVEEVEELELDELKLLLSSLADTSKGLVFTPDDCLFFSRALADIDVEELSSETAFLLGQITSVFYNCLGENRIVLISL